MDCVAYFSTRDGTDVCYIMTEFPIELPPSKMKGGTITTKDAAFGENECLHVGYEVKNASYFASDQIAPLPESGQYAQYAQQTIRFSVNGGGVLKLPLCVCPGYFQSRDETITYSSYTRRLISRTSCNGNTGRIYQSTTTVYPSKKMEIQNIGNVEITYYPLKRKFIEKIVSTQRVIIDGVVTSETVSTPTRERQVTKYGKIADLVDPMLELLPYVSVALNGTVLSPYSMRIDKPNWKQELAKATTASISNMSSLVGMNTSLYLYELKEVLGIVNDLSKVIAKPTDPASWANFYLSTKWGTPQTLADTEKLMRKLVKKYNHKQYKYRISRGAVTSQYLAPLGPVQCRCTCKLRASANPGWAQGVVRKGIELGLWPTFKGVYDFIPFSFICGWFSNIDEILGSIDASLYSEYHNIVQGLYSIKEVATVPIHAVAGNYPFPSVQIEAKVYRRIALSSAVMPYVPKLDLENPTSVNVLDGGALIIQRL